MSFKYDWFTAIRPDMERWVPKDAWRVLEIGCFEGMATCWFLDHCPSSVVTVVDHFKGGEDQGGLDLTNLKQRFLENTKQYGMRVLTFDGDSWDMLRHMEANWFPVVLVDGSHVAKDVLNDLIQAYRCCTVGGLIIADDYTWENHRPDCPKVAIDAFLTCFAGSVKLEEVTRIAVIRKVC